MMNQRGQCEQRPGKGPYLMVMEAGVWEQEQPGVAVAASPRAAL